MTDAKQASMWGVGVEGDGLHPESLKVVSCTRPVPGEGEILIRVFAAGVNRADILQRMGLYPPPPGASELMGLEVAGEVVVPAGRWKAGDKVCALLGGGGYGEYVVCDARHALPVPEGFSWAEAAGVPETFFTVYANVFDDGGLKAGQTLMIHGANSGIGITAIQMAKALGAHVLATARRGPAAEAALKSGADWAVDTTVEDFAGVAAAHGGVDVVLDMVGGPYFAGNLESLKFGGRIVYIAALGGANITVPVMALMKKHAVVTGSTIRARPADEKARLAEKLEREIWPLLAEGRIRPRIDKIYPMDKVAEAHARMDDSGHVGKVILKIGE